ncbi:transposase [Roseomonas sp. CCTCC AB2023176]|uniref:transposase n=1 Tax=Roseomonas sp. CCTCC AB2023176 TaxID=3342640 RepID=UPI0035DF025D
MPAIPLRPAGAPFTPPRPWSPLSDTEWGALLPYVWRRAPQGRQVGDLRARMDAIFHMACRGYGIPWREVPDVYGKPDTVSRFFRRLTHGGLWHALLESLAWPELSPDHPLRIEHFIVRACRRAARLGGLRLLFLIKRLGLQSALPGPYWLLPDQLLSEAVRTMGMAFGKDWQQRPGERDRDWRARLRDTITTLKRLHRMAAGRRTIHPSLRRNWP